MCPRAQKLGPQEASLVGAGTTVNAQLPLGTPEAERGEKDLDLLLFPPPIGQSSVESQRAGSLRNAFPWK